MAGAYDVVIAAGVESMTRVPMGASVADGKYGFPFGPDDDEPLPQPRSAGHLGRVDLREVGHHAARTTTRSPSSRTAAPRARTEEGRFDREILPVTVTTDERRRVDDA